MLKNLKVDWGVNRSGWVTESEIEKIKQYLEKEDLVRKGLELALKHNLRCVSLETHEPLGNTSYNIVLDIYPGPDDRFAAISGANNVEGRTTPGYILHTDLTFEYSKK